MSLFVLATGSLISDPQRRTSNNGKSFTTATIRAATDDGSALISAIAFGDQSEALSSHRQGSAIAVSGRAKLTSWTGKDGKPNHGLSVVVEQIASASAARRADADRRRSSRTAGAVPRTPSRRAVGDVGAGDGRPLHGEALR